MDFEYTEQQSMFRQMTRDFATKRVAPLAQEIGRTDRFPAELVKDMAELGLFGVFAPKEYGGTEADHISYCIVLEELSKVSIIVADIVGLQNSLGGVPILEYGNDEQKQKYLPRLINGETLAAIAVTEPNHGSDGAVETSAVLSDGHWVINGSKMFITGGDVADLILTIAQSDKTKGHRGTVAFLVEREMSGFSSRALHGKLGKQGSAIAELNYDNVQIPTKNVLGKVGEGLKVGLAGMDDSRIQVASTCVGLSQGCIDASIEYAKQRVQFGKIIGSFQLVQAMIADMIVDVEAARLLIYRAASLMDKGQRGLAETSYAKLFASEVAQRVSWKAIQVHGGYGYTDDMPVERYFRDARVLTIIEGTSDIQRLHIGRKALGINALI